MLYKQHTMFQRFSIKVPLNLEVGVLFRFNSTFKMKRFSLPKREFWLQWSNKNWFGISSFWSWYLTLIFWKICILSFLNLLQTSLALWMLSVKVNISLTYKRIYSIIYKNNYNSMALHWIYLFFYKIVIYTIHQYLLVHLNVPEVWAWPLLLVALHI